MRIRFTPPPDIVDIARRLEAEGFEAWAVGGAVRDALAGVVGSDWDVATNARPADVRRIFRRTVPIGIEHGTVGVLTGNGVLYEVTTFRRDVQTFGRHAVVEFADDIDTDLSRRDFTFNAIAWNPLTDVLHDPFGGIADLEARLLRTVGDPGARLAEDWLRVLRGLRFAGHFSMRIHSLTWAAMTAAVPHLSELSAERVREEITKVLGKTRHASTSLELYRESGALAALLPELAALTSIEIGVNGDTAWKRTLRAVDAVPVTRLSLRLAVLFHGIGMPATRARDLRGGWRFTGHPIAGGERAREVMQRLRASNADIERVAALVERQDDWFPPDATDPAVRRWLARVTPSFVNDLFRMRVTLWRADGMPGGDHDLKRRVRRARQVLRQRPVLSLSGLAIGGEDLKRLGLEPGPRFGEILRHLLDRVIEEPDLNRADLLLDIARAESERG